MKNTNLLANYSPPVRKYSKQNQSADKPLNLSGFKMLEKGLDAFVARVALIEQATSTIDLKSFIFKDDAIGRIILEMLAKAADRGVKVRLLLDDLWSGSQDKLLLAFDKHPNIEIRLFNPLARTVFKELQYVTRFGSITRRMHNKALMSDGVVAVAGGRNIAMEYFDLKPGLNFADLDVIAVGPVVTELSTSFTAFWNNGLSVPIGQLIKTKINDAFFNDIRKENQHKIFSYEKVLGINHYIQEATNSVLAQNILKQSVGFTWGTGKVIADDPNKLLEHRKRVDLHLAGKMEKLFAEAKKEVVIISPYFLPGKNGVEDFAQMVKNGIRVLVITNSLGSNNHGVVHAHYSKYRQPLLEAGVQLYEVQRKLADADKSNRSKNKNFVGNQKWRDKLFDKDQVLHAKVFMFDRQKIFVGSLNLDPRSWVENTEIGILMGSKEIGDKLSEWIDNDVRKTAYKLEIESTNGQSKVIWKSAFNETFQTEPEASFWKRFKLKMLSLLPIEPLL